MGTWIVVAKEWIPSIGWVEFGRRKVTGAMKAFFKVKEYMSYGKKIWVVAYGDEGKRIVGDHTSPMDYPLWIDGEEM